MNQAVATATGWARCWQDYYRLCKPRVVGLIVFTAVGGMLLAVPGVVPFEPLIFGTLGIGLIAGAAAAFNQLADRGIDGLMTRTRYRPLVTGSLTVRQAVVLATLMAAAGFALLYWLVNPLTAYLTLASGFGYAGIYTLFLKRATPQNIVIGGAAGAMPPLLGWTAVTGQVDPPALLMFLIIFLWTPPHFWALAIHRRREYAKADIPMLPVTHGVGFTALHALLYTVLLTVVSILPYLIGMSGLVYLSGALLLGGIFLRYAWRLYRIQSDEQAMATFRYSLIYLPILFAFMLADHYLRAALAMWAV